MNKVRPESDACGGCGVAKREWSISDLAELVN
jgi:hypothetical protein